MVKVGENEMLHVDTNTHTNTTSSSCKSVTSLFFVVCVPNAHWYGLWLVGSVD